MGDRRRSVACPGGVALRDSAVAHGVGSYARGLAIPYDRGTRAGHDAWPVGGVQASERGNQRVIARHATQAKASGNSTL